MSGLRILVVDDHEMVRRGIREIVETQGHGWRVCGEGLNGRDAIDKVNELKPDLTLLDVSMPVMNGLDATRQILQQIPNAKILIVSQNDPSLMRNEALRAGAKGFIEKSKITQTLIPTIESLFDGTAFHAQNQDLQDKDEVLTSSLTEKQKSQFKGEGKMSALMRSTDWAQTPLGSAESWSPSLRMIVNFMLTNRFPQLLWWGPQFCSLYNDDYIPVLGDKHPWALGRPVTEVWGEIWDVLKPLVETPYLGGPATWMEDIELTINRRNFTEETHFTIAYSAVHDETVGSGIGGVLATVHEITAKVLGERRIAVLRELSVQTVESKSAEQSCAEAAHTLSHHTKDVPFALIYLFDSLGQAQLAGAANIADEDLLSLKTIDNATGAAIWPVAKMKDSESIELIEDLSNKFHKPPLSAWLDPLTSAAVVPLRSNVAHQLAGYMIAGISPRCQFDENYRNFFELMSTQIATTIANARSYEEERKRSEALAEIDRAKTAFFSNVSHEFRTPLTLMMGPLEDALAQPEGTSESNRERIDLAHRNSMRLLKLVNTLLDFSRIEAGRIQASYEPTDLAKFTADLASIFRSAVERAGVQLIVNCSPFTEPVFIDREMWEKIVLNLISNAFKFTFEGKIEVTLRQVGTHAELTVGDSGTGIPEDEIPRLFERFHRVHGARGRSYEGSGIGLALVQELVKLHGGTVRVESELDQGSKFIISIPFGKDHLPADRIRNTNSSPSMTSRNDAFLQEALRWLPDNKSADDLPTSPLLSSEDIPTAALATGRMRVLLADDNADMRDYVQRLLNKKYEVITVSDGHAALKRAHEQRPDLILSDVMMPEMDGFALLQAVRADHSLKDVPVILLSARAGEESRLEGLSSGADDYLIKPFSARELLSRIQSNLKTARLRKEAQMGLRESEERLRALVNASSYVVYRMSPDWKEMRQLDGQGFISDTQSPNTNWIDRYIHPDDRPRVIQTIQDAIENKAIFELEHRVIRPDGSLGWTLSRAVPVLNEDGEIAEWFGAASDVTKRKEAEENYRGLVESLDAEVRARTRELEDQNLYVLRQSEQVRDLSWRLLRTQEEERRHIARELHDSAGQTLTILGMNLMQLISKVGGDNSLLGEEIRECEEIVKQLQREIRTTSYLLHPPLLDETGLPSALSWYVQGLKERSGLELALNLSQDFGRLPRDMELVIFRLVQECLTNIHRHSESKTATITIVRDSHSIHVEIKDQGKGMSPERLAEINAGGSGVGIRGMRERLLQYGGKMNITSGKTGTQISVTIPAPKDTTSIGIGVPDSISNRESYLS